jgi:hypothetical protein
MISAAIFSRNSRVNSVVNEYTDICRIKFIFRVRGSYSAPEKKEAPYRASFLFTFFDPG